MNGTQTTHWRVVDSGCVRIPDPDPDPSYLEQEGFEDRLAEYRSGGFGFIGILAWATIEAEGEPQQTIQSGGLWSIESDSDESYLLEVEEEERSELSDILESLGI